MKIGVFKNENRGIRVAFDVVTDITVVLISFNNGIKIVVIIVGGVVVAIYNKKGGYAN